jgi:hypothetical protein
MLRLDQKGGSDGLLAQVFVHDPKLNLLHQLFTEKPHDGGINPGRHHTEGIAGCDKAIMRLESLESGLKHDGAGQPIEPLAKRGAHRFFRMDKSDRLQHFTSLLPFTPSE